MSNTISLPIKLTPGERRKLRSKTTGYRKMITAAQTSEVSRYTIYNAIAGKNIRPEMAGKIRTFLNSL